IQPRRLRNQFLDSRPHHIGYAPQFHVSHALPRSLQQLLRIRQSRPAQERKRHMLFSYHEAAQRPFESNEGLFHGFTYSSPPFTVFFTSSRTAFATPSNFPAFFTYALIQTPACFPSIVGIGTSYACRAVLLLSSLFPVALAFRPACCARTITQELL